MATILSQDGGRRWQKHSRIAPWLQGGLRLGALTKIKTVPIHLSSTIDLSKSIKSFDFLATAILFQDELSLVAESNEFSTRFNRIGARGCDIHTHRQTHLVGTYYNYMICAHISVIACRIIINNT